MLLNAVGGCAAWVLGLACAVFVLEEEVGWLVGAPRAGEARELGFALEMVPATLGPPKAAPLVGVNGMVEFIAVPGTFECFVNGPTLVRGGGGLWCGNGAVLHATLGSRVHVETIASQCIPR